MMIDRTDQHGIACTDLIITSRDDRPCIPDDKGYQHISFQLQLLKGNIQILVLFINVQFNKLNLSVHQTVQGFHLIISRSIHQGTAVRKNTVCRNIIS